MVATSLATTMWKSVPTEADIKAEFNKQYAQYVHEWFILFNIRWNPRFEEDRATIADVFKNVES